MRWRLHWQGLSRDTEFELVIIEKTSMSACPISKLHGMKIGAPPEKQDSSC